MNTRSMTAPRRVDARWPQTMPIPRRANRQADNAYRRRDKRQRTRVEWYRVLIVTGATLLVIATLLYKFTGPA
jgi:hypothetical protein